MGQLHSFQTHITQKVPRTHEIGVLRNRTQSPGHDSKKKKKKKFWNFNFQLARMHLSFEPSRGNIWNEMWYVHRKKKKKDEGGGKRLIEVGGRDQQCLVYYEQKDIFRIYKHPHSSFQRELLTWRDCSRLFLSPVFTMEVCGFLSLLKFASIQLPMLSRHLETPQ